MKALILAAGRGKRMKGMNGDKPKSYLEFADRPIIRHQIDALGAIGIAGYDIYIVMGYGFEHLLKDFGQDHALIANHFWDNTNTAASVDIACGWSEIDEDLLILNGDVICDPQLIRKLAGAKSGNAAIVQYKDVGDEEVGFDINSKGIISTIGKKLKGAKGEAVGLYKISPKFIKKYHEEFNASDFGNYYEDVFDRIKVPMEAVDAGDLLVFEIDTQEDYAKATEAYNKQHGSNL